MGARARTHAGTRIYAVSGQLYPAANRCRAHDTSHQSTIINLRAVARLFSPIKLPRSRGPPPGSSNYLRRSDISPSVSCHTEIAFPGASFRRASFPALIYLPAFSRERRRRQRQRLATTIASAGRKKTGIVARIILRKPTCSILPEKVPAKISQTVRTD